MASLLELVVSILLACCVIIIQSRLSCGAFMTPEGLEHNGHNEGQALLQQHLLD